MMGKSKIAFLGFSVLVGFGFVAYGYDMAVDFGNIMPIASCKDPTAIRIVHEMATAPNDWQDDGYRVHSPSRHISVWTANKVYGLGVSVGDGARPNQGDIERPCRAEIYRYARALSKEYQRWKLEQTLKESQP